MALIKSVRISQKPCRVLFLGFPEGFIDSLSLFFLVCCSWTPSPPHGGLPLALRGSVAPLLTLGSLGLKRGSRFVPCSLRCSFGRTLKPPPTLDGRGSGQKPTLFAPTFDPPTLSPSTRVLLLPPPPQSVLTVKAFAAAPYFSRAGGLLNRGGGGVQPFQLRRAGKADCYVDQMNPPQDFSEFRIRGAISGVFSPLPSPPQLPFAVRSLVFRKSKIYIYIFGEQNLAPRTLAFALHFLGQGGGGLGGDGILF